MPASVHFIDKSKRSAFVKYLKAITDKSKKSEKKIQKLKADTLQRFASKNPSKEQDLLIDTFDVEDLGMFNYLVHAAGGEDYSMVDFILNNGGDPNTTIVNTDNETTSPILEAVKDREDYIVRLLLRHGADPMLPNNEPLNRALTDKMPKMVQLLTEHGAILRATDAAIMTTIEHYLHQDAETPKGDVLRILNMVHWKNKPKELGRILVESFPFYIKSPDSQILPTLFVALVKLLLKHSPDVNTKDDHGDTPLHYSLHYGLDTTFKDLLKHGVDVNAVNNNGETPLHYAVKYGTVDTFKALVKRGTDVNVKNNNGKTVFNYVPFHDDDLREYIQSLKLPEKIKKLTTRVASPKEIEKTCNNIDIMTLEPFSSDDLPTLVRFKTNAKADVFECMRREELHDLSQQFQMYDQYFLPLYLFADWIQSTPKKNISDTGYGGVPGSRLFVKLPVFGNIFVTVGSYIKVLTSTNVQSWYIKPLNGSRPVRVGNMSGIYGSSMNHGQLPGEVIYKLVEDPDAAVTEEEDEYTIAGLERHPNTPVQGEPLHHEIIPHIINALADVYDGNVIEGGRKRSPTKVRVGKRWYTVRQGSRGGSYILVNKKKVYIKKTIL